MEGFFSMYNPEELELVIEQEIWKRKEKEDMKRYEVVSEREREKIDEYFNNYRILE